jgi:hypothetical protein
MAIREKLLPEAQNQVVRTDNRRSVETACVCSTAISVSRTKNANFDDPGWN